MRPTTLNRGRKARVQHIERRFSPSEWEPLKAEIDRLYRDEGWTQVEVVGYLNTKRGFRVTKRQLVEQLRKWKFKKYNTSHTQKDEDMTHTRLQDGSSANEMRHTSNYNPESLAHILDGADPLTTHIIRALISGHDDVAGPPHFPFSDTGCSALQSCIRWTTEQLENVSDMPVGLDMLDGEEYTRLDTWREDTELFLTLWLRWQTSRSEQLGWVEGAQLTLGVSATELLATVSGMVLDVGVDDYDGDGYEYGHDDESEKDSDYALGVDYSTMVGGQDESELQSAGGDGIYQEKLLDHAREGVQAIGGMGKEEMWEIFSETSDRRNCFLSNEPGRLPCLGEALVCIRNFVTGNLAEGRGV